MKKIFASIFLCVILVVSMTACKIGRPGVIATTPTSDPSIKETEPFSYRVQYIRTDGYVDGKAYPYVVMILNTEELADYITANENTYDMGSRDSGDSDKTGSFLDAVTAYDDEFFSKNALLMVIAEEPSGSIRHEVIGFGEKNTIRIRRLVPEIGTDDMAEWHILIEVPISSPVLVSAYYPAVEWVVGEAVE